MKNNFTSFIGRLFVTLLMLVFIGSFANAAPKRMVLLEEFTGTWCGPCGANGKPMMAQILAAHPDDVIGVEVHLNDEFDIPEGNTLAGAIGVSGIPCAAANRTYNLAGTGAVVGYVSSWTSMVTDALAIPAKVEVKLFYMLNKTSRTLTANIEANFAEAASGDLRFNVIITEDDLIADQNGAYANYHHMHVLRDMLGDTWGTSGKIPSTVSSGQNFKHSYSFPIPAGWNLDNLHFIGVVQEYNGTLSGVKILNCVKGVEGQPDMEFTCTSGQQTSAVAVGVTAQRDFEIKNLTNTQKTYNINVTKTSRTPSNWIASVVLPSGAVRTSKDGITADELVIGPLAKKTVTLQLTPGDMIGIGDAEMSVKEKNNSTATEGKGSVTVASAEIDKFQIVDDDEGGSNSLAVTIQNSGNNGYFDFSVSDFLSIYSQFTKLNTVVWTLGKMGELNDEEATTLKNIIDGGTPVLISGEKTVASMDLSLPNLLFKIGCSFGGESNEGQNNGWNITLVGYNGDPITNGFERTINLLNHYKTEIIEVNNPKTYPILKHKNVDQVLAVRSELANARVVLLGINPLLITSQSSRNTLINNALKWLNGIGPKITSSASEVDFGDVAINSQKDMTVDIENTGEEALNVSEMSVDWEYSNVFTIVSPSAPFSVQPGMSETVTIRFKPSSEFGYNVNLTIKSNAVNDNEIVVNLKGNGTSSNTGPEISADVQAIDFGEVPINHPNDNVIEITNTGNQTLSISSLNIVSDVSDIFEVVSPTSFPVSVQSGAKTNITVKFSPTEKIAYTGVLEINSNATNGNKLSVNLDGIGGNPDGVQDEEGNSISVTAGPNPFNARTTISYTVAGNGGLVEMSVIDSRGMTITQLVSKNLAAGDYSDVFDAKGLSSGVYYIIARINGHSEQIPIVIEK